MPLDKKANWGTLPPPKPLKPGIATVMQDGLRRIADNTAGAVRPPTPSPDAFRMIACLGQVRDALLDQRNATLGSVNTLLTKAIGSKSAQEAKAALTALDPALAQEFEQQFSKLSRGAFEAQRRARVAELIAFEAKLSGRVK